MEWNTSYEDFAMCMLKGKTQEEKEEIFLESVNYDRYESGDVPYTDISNLIESWGYSNLDELVTDYAYDSFDDMMIEEEYIYPAVYYDNKSIITLPNGEKIFSSESSILYPITETGIYSFTVENVRRVSTIETREIVTADLQQCMSTRYKIDKYESDYLTFTLDAEMVEYEKAYICYENAKIDISIFRNEYAENRVHFYLIHNAAPIVQGQDYIFIVEYNGAKYGGIVRVYWVC